MKHHQFITGAHQKVVLTLLSLLSFTCFVPVHGQDIDREQEQGPGQDSLLTGKIIYKGLHNPTSLYVTRNHIYIVDQDENQLIKLDHFGNERDRIGGSGSGDYQFSTPVDVDATNGLKIYVSDYNNRRIQVFDRRGQYLSSLNAYEDRDVSRFSPTQIVVNDVGEVYFFNELTKSILMYGFNGSFAASYPLPRNIEQVDDILFHDQSFYVLDKESGVIHLLSENWITKSFFPAAQTMAFAISGGDIWHVKKEEIYFDGRDSVKSYNWKPHFNTVDAQIMDNFLFVLDKRNLYKISLPK